MCRKDRRISRRRKDHNLVSHDLHAIRSLCDEVLWLEKGEVRAIGPAKEVVDAYLGHEP